MRARAPAKPHIANDNAKSAAVISLAARRDEEARRRALMREWAPAVLATFFTGDSTFGPQPLAAGAGRRSDQR